MTTAPAAALATLCERVGLPTTSSPRLPGALERGAVTVRALFARRSELAAAREYRLAMEALDRRRIAIIQARSPRLCTTCAGGRRTVDSQGVIERCRSCGGQGVTR